MTYSSTHWKSPLPIGQPLGVKSGGNINIARDGNKLVAIIVPAVAPDGYSGDIQMIIGINVDGTVAGVRGYLP